jgi:hypothetical protein
MRAKRAPRSPIMSSSILYSSLNFPVYRFLKIRSSISWFHKVLAVVKPGLAGPSVECKQVTTGIIEDWWGPAHDVGGPAHDVGGPAYDERGSSCSNRGPTAKNGLQVPVAGFLLTAAGTFGGLPSASKQSPELVKSSPGRSNGRPIFGSSSLRD